MQHTIMPHCPKLSSASAVTQHSKAKTCLNARYSEVQEGLVHVHHKTAVIIDVVTTMMECLTS